MIVVPLLDRYADSGEPIDYLKLSRALEEQVRAKGTGKFRVYIVGFGKLVGDLIEGLATVISYFAISVAIAALFVFLYTRCLRSTVVLVVTAVLGVMWLMGLLQILGYELDPYSILVPFLLFAIGLSHGAQKMNGIMQDVGRGTHKYVAARYTFRRLFLAGLTALLTNVVGFMVLIIIDIPVIRDLAVMTSIGVTGLIFTKLVLIPVLLSYTGVSPKAAQRSLNADAAEQAGRSAMGRVWAALERLTERRWALVAIAAAALLGAGALSLRTGLKIGDLDEGAPELRRDSRYNLDNAYIARHYGLSSDQFAVIVKTPKSACDRYEGLVEADRLGWELEHVQGVKAVTSFAEQTKRGVAASSEGYFKWNTLARDPRILGPAANRVIQDNPDAMNPNCSLFAVTAYLSDHRADTLDRVLKAVEGFAATHSRPGAEFLPAAGPAGIEAVTNIVVRQSFYIMHVVLYIAVTLLCFVTFRSWRAVVVALVPLLITSILCEAIMVRDGHRREGRDLAGHRARRGRRRRLCAVPAVGAARGAAPRRQPARGLQALARIHRQGRRADRRDDGRRRRDLGLVADQVPGRHGHPADLHVPVEHDRRAGADPGAVALPAARCEAARHDGFAARQPRRSA